MLFAKNGAGFAARDGGPDEGQRLAFEDAFSLQQESTAVETPAAR